MTAEPVVPFSRVLPQGDELANVQAAVDGHHVSGAGPFAARCEQILSSVTGVERTLLTTSCTHALEMSCHLLDLEPGDEVIVPSFTFVSTAAAVAMRGAVPVFVDVREDTFCLDERQVAAATTERTRALIAVHYAGVACEMDELLEIAGVRGLEVVEDNAHGLFGTYRGRPLGSLGALSTLSFHETKNISCGEGGALQINRGYLVERAEMLREKGTDRTRFMRGEVDKYTWTELGSSWVPSDMLAAFLCGQLERRDEIQRRRHEIWDAYSDELSGWARERGWRTPEVLGDRDHPAHMFWLLAPSRTHRDRLLEHVRAAGVQAVFHYVPLHSSPMGIRAGRASGELPVTERVSGSLVRLPLWAGMTEEMVDRVVAAVRSFDGSVGPDSSR